MYHYAMGLTSSAERQQKEEEERKQKEEEKRKLNKTKQYLEKRQLVVNALYNYMGGYLTVYIKSLGPNGERFADYFPDKLKVNYGIMFTNDEIELYGLNEKIFCKQVYIKLIQKIIAHIDINKTQIIYLEFLARETILYMWNMVINGDIMKPINDNDIKDFFNNVKNSIGNVNIHTDLIEYKIIREIIFQSHNLPGDIIIKITKEKWNNIAVSFTKPVRRAPDSNQVDDKSPPSYEVNQTQQDQLPSAPDCHLVDQPPSYDVDQPSTQNEST